MQLRAEQLEAHLANALARSSPGLAPVYLVHGDEALLALEAADAIRAAARRRGHDERQVFVAERHFDWSELSHAGATRSLFGGRRVLELRIPSGKPGADGAAAIERYCADPSPDDVLLVTMPRPEGAAWKSGWFAALGAKGTVIEVLPVPRRSLPAWIAARLARQGQRAGPEVLEFLAERVEGNLLAAHQEVQKLALLAEPGELELEAVQQVVTDVARYDPYIAAEALLARDLGRYVRAIEGLQGEAEAPTFVLHALATMLFVLAEVHAGKQPESACRDQRLFNKPLQRAITNSPRAFPRAAVAQGLVRCAVIDRVIKGLAQGNPWDEFIKLGLRLVHAREG